MLRSLKDLENYAIRATDGAIGHVKDFYFEDNTWVVRYLVVETGAWLSSRKVLISPISIGKPDWAEKELPVSLTQQQIKDSPDIDTTLPVSRQHEIQYLSYYGYPQYWGGPGMWAGGMNPGTMLLGDPGLSATPFAIPHAVENVIIEEEALRHQQEDIHLRSYEEVAGYRLHAIDGELGHVQGMLMDEETWAVRYLIIDTSNWWMGHKVLISPRWIEAFNWAEATVSINLTRQMIKEAPHYDPDSPLDRMEEQKIHEYYGRAGYWTDENLR
jgi:hypothetical protein